MKRKLLTIAAIMAIALGATSSFAQDETAPEQPKTQKVEKATEVEEDEELDIDILKSKISKMRGKLLAKKNQIRKYETKAIDKDATLESKLQGLEEQRRKLFVEAEEKLLQLYLEQDEIATQIDDLVEERTKLEEAMPKKKKTSKKK